MNSVSAMPLPCMRLCFVQSEGSSFAYWIHWRVITAPGVPPCGKVRKQISEWSDGFVVTAIIRLCHYSIQRQQGSKRDNVKAISLRASIRVVICWSGDLLIWRFAFASVVEPVTNSPKHLSIWRAAFHSLPSTVHCLLGHLPIWWFVDLAIWSSSMRLALPCTSPLDIRYWTFNIQFVPSPIYR